MTIDLDNPAPARSGRRRQSRGLPLIAAVLLTLALSGERPVPGTVDPVWACETARPGTVPGRSVVIDADTGEVVVTIECTER